MRELPDALHQRLQSLPLHHYAAGALLQAADARAEHVFLIETGLVRLFALDAEGREFNHGFHGPGDWVFGRIVWREGTLCCDDRAIGVAALQPTSARRVPTALLGQWRSEDARIGDYLLDRLMRFTAERLGREQDQVLRSAEQRYRDLLRSQPNITRDVPLQQIASWLGITPVALSRIRKRVHGSGRP